MSLEERRAWRGRHGEREVRCILMTAWDPIGVGFQQNASDGHDDHALKIARRLYVATDDTAARDQVAAVLDGLDGT